MLCLQPLNINLCGWGTTICLYLRIVIHAWNLFPLHFFYENIIIEICCTSQYGIKHIESVGIPTILLSLFPYDTSQILFSMDIFLHKFGYIHFLTVAIKLFDIRREIHWCSRNPFIDIWCLDWRIWFLSLVLRSICRTFCAFLIFFGSNYGL